jgi:hypothetical protein
VKRAPALVAVVTCLVVSLPAVAGATPLEPYLQRSADADFSGEQVVTCETPSGSRTVAMELVQAGGTTVARSAAGGGSEVQVAGGWFSVVTEEGSVDTSAVAAVAIPAGRYTVSNVESLEVLGRDAERITVTDDAGIDRAVMVFDIATGALLESRIRNADGSVYCEIKMVDFDDTPTISVPVREVASASRTLEPVEPPAGGPFPESVAGFARLETYEWEKGGVVGYYSDGLFSFTLLATRRPVILDAATAAGVTIDGGDYVRWFGAGQSIYVWETTDGGLTFYGDLPIDLQEAVLAELPDPTRIGVLARWWRNLFG